MLQPATNKIYARASYIVAGVVEVVVVKKSYCSSSFIY